MKIIHFIVATLVVGQIVTIALIKRLDNNIQSLDQPPTTNEVAEALLAGHKAEIVARLSSQIIENEENIEKLRGEPGVAPDTEEIYNYMMIYKKDEFFPTLEQEFWKQHKIAILENPGLIADVAEAVYQTYGNSLKGQKGQDAKIPPIEDIVKILSKDYEFAQLVADFKN